MFQNFTRVNRSLNMAIHKTEKQILLFNYEGEVHEDFQEVYQEVNYSYNYKPERLNSFRTACAAAASFPALYLVSSRCRKIYLQYLTSAFASNPTNSMQVLWP